MDHIFDELHFHWLNKHSTRHPSIHHYWNQLSEDLDEYCMNYSILTASINKNNDYKLEL